MKSKKLFTLLEVIIAFFIIAISASGIGFKLYSLLEKKRFSSDVDRVMARMVSLHVLSQLNHQDVFLKTAKTEGKIIFSSFSLTQNYFFQDPPLTIDEAQFILNQNMTENLDVTFYSSGQIKPLGVLTIVRKEMKKEIVFSELFSFYQGDRLGPFHPLREN